MNSTKKNQQGIWRLLGRYLIDQSYVISAYILFVCIFAVVFWLYNLPIEAVGYAALLSGSAGLILGMVRFWFYCNKFNTLKDKAHTILFEIDNLPIRQNSIEKEYTKLISLLYEEKSRHSIQAEMKLHNAREYYTLWVHQIKTPIAAMRLLLQGDNELNKEELQAELFEIEQYVEMVLSYVRMSGSSSDYIIEYCDLDSVVRRAVRKYARLFIRKKIRLDFKESGLSVLTDHKWLVFVIEQILSNALKYTAKGSINIYTESGKTLVIEDTGIGIAQEDLPRIFEQGFTGYNGRTGKQSTGIGLFLSRQILNKLTHTIEIESEIGRGTKVKINLDSVPGDEMYFE